MPSVPSKKSKPGAYPTFDEFDVLVAEQDNGTRTNNKKGRNPPAKQPYVDEEIPDAEVARERSPSPSRPQSILGQTSRAFVRKNPSLDVLDALGTSQKVSDQSPTRTDEWAREVPYGKSPPADSLARLSVSGSPPVIPGLLGRGGFSTRSPPVSPGPRLTRPVSYGSAIPPLPVRQGFGEHPFRYLPGAYGSPPAPHQPQPHFYSANDVDLGLGRGGPQLMSIEPSFVAFSHTSFLDIASSRRLQPTILVGSEGRLDVLANHSNKLEPLGALHGLPGTVVDARFLTWESGHDPFSAYRPLVAVSLHGPKLADDTDKFVAASDDGLAQIIAADAQPTNMAILSRPEYQTRIEIYSLNKCCHISTLLKTPLIPMEPGFRGQPPQIPAPGGNLRIDVQGNFLTVSSGTSGEVYVFGINTSSSSPGFECLGKFWTSIQPQSQRRDSSHGRSADADISPADLNRRMVSSEAPIISLSGRWLAIAPAMSPSRPTMGASLGPSVAQKRLSIRDLRIAPTRPPVTCEVDSPDADTILSKAVREVAQGVARGARWFADQGIQTWNNYWKKDQPPSPSPRAGYDPQFYSPQPLPPQFPPTHSLETQTNTREPDLVSLFDLKAIQKSSTKQKTDDLKPVATFQPPGGCSFLSFMPNGLGLLTVSRKGDIQYVWDLMQIKHCRSAGVIVDTAPTEANTSPRVRQLAKFPRLTTSTVIDVVWESAVGDRFAIVTKNGTIHVFDLPITAFRWPPARRTEKPRPTSAPVDVSTLVTSDEPLPSGGILAQAINIAGNNLANLRGRAPSLGAGIGGIGNSGIGLASATGVRGGRVVAAGLSKSLGAATGTVNHLRHAGDNRLHLRSLANDPTPGRVAWDFQFSRAIICILDKAAVRSYYVRRSAARENTHQQRASVFDARKRAGLKIPEISSLIKRAIGAQEAANSEGADQPQSAVAGWCSPKLSQPAVTAAGISHPLSHAEIESNAPYQPFHSDARVNLFIYPEGPEMRDCQFPTASAIFDPPSQRPSVTGSPNQWVFGNDVPGHQLKIHSTGTGGDVLYGDSGSIIYRETIASPTKRSDEDELAEQIVSTTRRRKKKPEASVLEFADDFDQEGFFEDDCDVLDFAGDRV